MDLFDRIPLGDQFSLAESTLGNHRISQLAKRPALSRGPTRLPPDLVTALAPAAATQDDRNPELTTCFCDGGGFFADCINHQDIKTFGVILKPGTQLPQVTID